MHGSHIHEATLESQQVSTCLSPLPFNEIWYCSGIDSHLIFRKISLLRNNLNNECQVEMILSYTILPVESVIVYYI